MNHLFKIKQIIFLFSVLILAVSIFVIHGVYAKGGTVVANKVVILDPGHGGWDPGKTGEKGSDEKDINLNPENLTELEMQILEYFEQNERGTNTKLLEFTNANRNTLKKALSNLVNKNYLIMHSKGRGAWYSITR